MQKPVIILGIDPGTLVMGYSVIEVFKNTFSVKTIDVLKLSSKKDHYQRLQMVHQKITDLVEEFSPHEFAIEAPFFGKNVQSMLKLGRAQGVAIAAAMTKNIPVTEYSPRKIKQSITGNGNASKEQVAYMLKNMLKYTEEPEFLDATDGLAAAVCHYFQNRHTAGAEVKSYTGRKAFLTDNPQRVK